MQRRRISRSEQPETEDNEKEFAQNVQDYLNQEPVENAVCLIKHSDGTIYFITYDGATDDTIGMMEVGKDAIIRSRFEDED